MAPNKKTAFQRESGFQRDIKSQHGIKRVAGVTGLEPAASGVTGRRSNQLSYTPS